jgi:hypothetical protein
VGKGPGSRLPLVGTTGHVIRAGGRLS